MLLTENLSPSQAKVIIEEGEDKGNGKTLYMKGIFIQGGVRNLNGRIYPMNEIRDAVDLINKQIDEGNSVCGECDHPESLTVGLDRISHDITKMWMDGNAGYGKLRILPTPKGNLIRTLIESGVRLGVSSRGSGDVDDNGHVKGFEIITVDIVMRPSCEAATPKPVFESLESRRGRVIEDLAKIAHADPRAKHFLHKELLSFVNKLR